MPRWRKGEDTINALVERGHLQQVVADTETAETLVATSERHVQSAATLADSDPEGAFSLAYDAARKAAAALLAHQGLRPTTAGGHLAVVDAINAQFPASPASSQSIGYAVAGTKPSTPDPDGYDPITPEEATKALEAARATVSAARRLLDAPQLGVF